MMGKSIEELAVTLLLASTKQPYPCVRVPPFERLYEKLKHHVTIHFKVAILKRHTEGAKWRARTGRKPMRPLCHMEPPRCHMEQAYWLGPPKLDSSLRQPRFFGVARSKAWEVLTSTQMEAGPARLCAVLDAFAARNEEQRTKVRLVLSSLYGWNHSHEGYWGPRARVGTWTDKDKLKLEEDYPIFKALREAREKGA